MVIIITGKVISSEAKEGIKGLRVEAWDKDLLVSDLVGGTTTGDGGIFRIQFDESYFKELFFDRRPDLFVKVFRGDKLIKSTEDSVLWNVDRENIEMTIEVEDSEGAITPEVVSSKEVETRSILQATYTPRKPKPEESLAKVSRGLEKGALLSYLAPSHEELDELTQRYTKELKKGAVDRTVKGKDLKTTEIISTAISKTGRINVLRSAKQFATLEVDTLCRVAQDLVGLREAALGTISEAHKTIIEEYTKASPPEEAAPATPGTTVKDLMEWAIKNNVETKSAHKTIELGKSLSFNLQKIELNSFRALASRHINRLSNTVDGCEESLATEHIGYLHLERMSFTPAGIERGRLVYSVPLSPGEEVNIRQREWSRTSEEFERIVTDYLEEFSEEGVTEKTELAQSVESQKQHSTAFDTAVSASGEAYGFSISASVGYNASESASKSEQITRNHTRELTSKASSRSKQEHKISFRVASARETEDETVQRIKNPFSDRATRVDYYQLIRKWQVDLYRYGIRLTYDIAIPEPGSGLLSKIKEINDIRKALEIGLEFWMEMILGEKIEMEDINPNNYSDFAGKFGAVLEGEPPLSPNEETKDLPFYKFFDWSQDGEQPIQDNLSHYETFTEVEIPETCEVLQTYYKITWSAWPEAGGAWWLKVSPVGQMGFLYDSDIGGSQHEGYFEGWRRATGKRLVHLKAFGLRLLQIEFMITVTGREHAYRDWQLKTWNAIQEAAQARHYENRQRLNEKLARLQEELGAQDALSLRKKEREEVMKGVLRFLVCPDLFESFFPKSIDVPVGMDIEEVLYELETTGLVKDEGFREDLLEHGEMIKFFHHAIEWENMLYFLYPYFWTHPRRWEFKKYLDHPDPMHRAFLKAGSARVVLTIRPGFEDAFLAFITTGDMNDLPSSPYLEIGQEFRNYANTNYPGIPPANPVDNYRPLLYPKQKQAWEDIQLIMDALDQYFRHSNETYPSTEKGLKLLKEATGRDIPLQDPWGHDYFYKCPGIYGDYDLASYGKNGEPNGEGEDADITSWAEASLIGQWFEYTPTSALDIAFDEEMPDK
jgi:hypothetical protein